MKNAPFFSYLQTFHELKSKIKALEWFEKEKNKAKQKALAD